MQEINVELKANNTWNIDFGNIKWFWEEEKNVTVDQEQHSYAQGKFYAAH